MNNLSNTLAFASTIMRFRNFLLLFSLSSLLIGGCLGGGGDSNEGNSSPNSGSSAGSVTQGIKIMGTGLDGPLSYGLIDFYNSDGTLCKATTTDENSFYEVFISADCIFPLKVVMTEGVDASSNLANPTTLYSLVLDQNISTININTYTTLIYYAALARTTDGSIQSIRSENINIDAVTYEITRKFNFGIDAEDPQLNPLKTPVTTNNIASFVKANEGMMEGIRRTAKAASANGEANASTIDQVLSALGTDISDGVLDGIDNNFTPQPYEVFNLAGSQLVGLWEAHALDVSMELMTNRLAISLTAEQKTDLAKTSGIPLINVSTSVSPSDVAQNLAAAIEHMVYDLGEFISPKEALQRLEQIGVTAKFLDQTQAALKFQMGLTFAKGLNLVPLNSIKAILDTITQRMISNKEIRLNLDQLRTNINKTNTNIVSTSVKDGSVDNKVITAAINNARFELNRSENLTQSRKKLSASWDYYGSNPEKFKLYETYKNTTKLVCVIPGNTRSSELGECYSNTDEIPKEFYLTAYAYGFESAPSPKIAFTNTMPVAIFHASVTAGQVPLAVDFNAASSYDPDGELSQFMRDFGDGGQASGISVSHTFQTQGTHNVLLKVWDNYASPKISPGSALATLRITVGEKVNTLTDPTSFIGSVRTLENDLSPSISFPEYQAKSSIVASSTKTSTGNTPRNIPLPVVAAQNETEKVDPLIEAPSCHKPFRKPGTPTRHDLFRPCFSC